MRKLKEKEITITIKMPKRMIQKMVGALRLGLTLEGWCADMWGSALQTYDSGSMRYNQNIAWIINQIHKQAHMRRRTEDYGWADKNAIKVLGDLAEAQCEKNRRDFAKRIRKGLKKIK